MIILYKYFNLTFIVFPFTEAFFRGKATVCPIQIVNLKFQVIPIRRMVLDLRGSCW